MSQNGGLVPTSHILTKAVGDTISASWEVINIGDAGLAALDIFFPSLGTGFFGALTSIPAGLARILTVSGVISTLVPGTTYNGEVRVTPAAPSSMANNGIHPFTLTISGGGGTQPPAMFAVGDRVRWNVSGFSFIGTVQQTFWNGTWWEDFVVFDPGQAGNPTDSWIRESLLVAA